MAGFDAHRDVRGVHVGHGGRVDELGPPELAVIEMDDGPMGHLVDGGVDGAGGADDRDVAEGDLLEALLLGAVGEGEIGVLLRFEDREIRPLHAQRLEDERADGVLPLLARQLFDQVAGGQVHQVVVLPLLAEVGRGLEIRQAPDELLAGDLLVVVPEEVMAGKARDVHDEVPDGQALPGALVVQLEPGDVVADRLVPFDLALVDELAEGEDREGLGGGADGEDGIRRDRELLLDVLEAEAPGVGDLVVLDDDHADAGDLEGLEPLFGDLVEAFQGRGDLGRRVERFLGHGEREGLSPLAHLSGDLEPVRGQLSGERSAPRGRP